MGGKGILAPLASLWRHEQGRGSLPARHTACRRKVPGQTCHTQTPKVSSRKCTVLPTGADEDLTVNEYSGSTEYIGVWAVMLGSSGPAISPHGRNLNLPRSSRHAYVGGEVGSKEAGDVHGANRLFLFGRLVGCPARPIPVASAATLGSRRPTNASFQERRTSTVQMKKIAVPFTA